MAELSSQNPTGRFNGLADTYARCRPTYPDEAVDFILAHCGLSPGAVLVDVGSGTGIASRLFARRGLHVIGVEPNADMRRQAAKAELPPEFPPPRYQPGSAEATGLPDATADAVLAAQAFHWFQPEPALREFRRILKAGGWVVLVWNERDNSDPFTAAYGAVIRSAPGAETVEEPRGRAGEILLPHPLYQDAERRAFRNEQVLDEEALLGRAFSASYAPQEAPAADLFAARLREVFARYQRNGRVVLRYETSVYVARCRPAVGGME
jgi:SAM-dependent methyltransferase